MAHTNTRGGTLLIDRRFRGVGRVARASGTTDARVFRRVNRMLSDLADAGRHDLLRAIRDGTLTPLQVHDAFQRRTLDTLPTASTVRPLVKAFRAWAEGYDCSEDYRRTLGTTSRYLEGLRAGAQVSELPELLERLRSTLPPTSFNRTRAHLLSFVRSTLKRNHPLWAALIAIEPGKVRVARPSVRLTPAEMAALFPAPQTDPVDAIAWTMATTGMHQKELWASWSVKADRISVEGTKREARRRELPLAGQPAVPRLLRRNFEDAVRERTREIVVYQLRGTYAHWLEEAGVPRTRRKLYMGHRSGDVTDLYERHEVSAFLAGDAAKLRRYLTSALRAKEFAALRQYLAPDERAGRLRLA